MLFILFQQLAGNSQRSPADSQLVDRSETSSVGVAMACSGWTFEAAFNKAGPTWIEKVLWKY